MSVVVTLIAIVDKARRKPMLLEGVPAWCCHSRPRRQCEPAGAEGPIAFIAANVFFGVSWGPVVWVLLGEMFPNRIRAAALAVAAAAQWAVNFTITTTFPLLADLGLTFAYGLYAVFAALVFVFVWSAVRET